MTVAKKKHSIYANLSNELTNENEYSNKQRNIYKMINRQKTNLLFLFL